MRQSKTQSIGNSEEVAMYAKEELMAHSKALFNCTPEVLIGALHGCEENEFTVEAANQRIHNFLQRKVLA